MKLKAAGIHSTADLLRCGKTTKDCKELAAATEIDEAKLLEAAGVDTIPELKHLNAKALYEKLVETNNEKKLVRKIPTADQVADWVEQAEDLPRVVEY